MTGPDHEPTPTQKAAWEAHLASEPRLAHYARFLVYVPFLALLVLTAWSLQS